MENVYEMGIGITAPAYDEATDKISATTVPSSNPGVDIKVQPPVEVPYYDKSISYDYPMSNVEGLTDYGEDRITLDKIKEGAKAGETLDSLFEMSGDSVKYQALLYKDKLSEGMKPGEAAAYVGIPFSAIREQGSMDRYILGVEEDNLKTSAGAANIVQGMSKLIYDDKSINYADELSAKSTAATDKFNAVSQLYNHLTASYDSKGRQVSSWDVAGTAGQMTTAGVAGVGIGTAVKGVTALQTAQRQAGASLAIGIGMETAQVGQHKDPAKFIMGVGSNLAGEALGLWMTKRFYKPDLGLQASKSTDEITTALDGMNLLKEHNIDLGSEDLLEPSQIYAKVKEQINTKVESGKLTEPEANEMLKVYNDRSLGLMVGLKKSLSALGISDSRQFQAYADGKIALDDMPEQFRDFWNSKAYETQARLAPKYDELKGLDGAAEGKPTQYNVIALNNKLEEVTLISKEVGNYVNSESKYLRRFETLDDQKLGKQMTGYTARKRTNSNNILNINSQIDSLEQQLAKLEGDNTGRRIALSRSSNSASRMTVGRQMVTTDSEIKAIKEQLMLGKLTRSNYLKAGRNLDKNIDGIKQAHRNLKTKDEMTFSDLVELRKSLTQKMFNRGGSLSADSDVQEEALGRAIGEIDKFMAKNVSKEAWVKLGLVNQEAKEAFRMWGGNSATKNMKKVVEKGSKTQLLAMFSGDNAQEALTTLKSIRGADDQMYIDMQAKVLGDKILDGVEKASGVKDMKKIDFDKLAENIRDPATRKLIVDVAGKDVYEGLNGIAYLSEVFGKEIEKVRTTTATLLRTNELTGDKFNQNVLSKYGARLSWLAERYTLGLIKGKHFTGSTQLGDVRHVLRDSIADAIEITAGQLNLRVDMMAKVLPKGTHINQVPNRTYTVNQAIRELKKELASRAPKEKLTLMDKVLTNFEDKVKAGVSEAGKSLKKSLSGRATAETGKVVSGGAIGGAAGYAAAPEGMEAEYAAAGAALGAGLGNSIGKKYKPNQINSVGSTPIAKPVMPHDIDTTDVIPFKDVPTMNRKRIAGALNDAVFNDRTYPLHNLPGKDKQTLIDGLFSSRKGNVEGGEIKIWAMSDNQLKVNRDYRGITTRMEPTTFLRLAAKRGDSLFDREKAALDVQRNIYDIYKAGKKPRISPPILYLEEVDGGLKVSGHEGRHRSNAIIEMFGYREIHIPVDIQIYERRAPRLTGDEWNKILISEDGKNTGLTLGDLFNKVEPRMER